MKNFRIIDFDTNRIYGLDILRSFAILFVVYGHGNGMLPHRLSKILNAFFFDGVTIFFVLSGYLIGGIIIKQFVHTDISFKKIKQFWIRRWFRTLPNYFLILSVLCILNIFFRDNFKLEEVTEYFYFSQNLFRVHPEFFPEAWSLSVEEWFYLLLPILLFIFSYFFKSYRQLIFYFALSLITVVLLYRCYIYVIKPPNNEQMVDDYFRKQVFTRFDSLMLGVIGAYCNFFMHDAFKRYKNILF